MKQINIDVYCICWNEIKILPFVIDYWKRFARHVYVYDNGSDDGSVELLKQYDWITVRHFDSDGIDERAYLRVKDFCWKGSDADYVVVCDTDECLYGTDLCKKLYNLKKEGYTVITPMWGDVWGNTYKKYQKGYLCHELYGGVLFAKNRFTSKQLIFDPKKITEIKYDYGCHTSHPEGEIKKYDADVNDDLYIVHLKHLGGQYVANKYEAYGKRLSKFNLKNNFAIQYKENPNDIKSKELELYERITKSHSIIPLPKEKHKKLYIGLNGGLGNKMFSICAGKKIAKDIGYDYESAFIFDNNKESDYIINHILKKCNFKNYKMAISKNGCIFPKNPNSYLLSNFKIPLLDKIILNAYFQDVKYIDKDIALELFAPYESIKKEINKLYGDLSNYVCVHVRRGDYMNPILQKIGYRTLSKEYVEKILNKYFPNAEVMIVSDDLDWCKQNFIGDKYHFADKECNNNVEMDLYIQSQCSRGNVISNSTFSWWGAYLNENENAKVVVPFPWYKNDFLEGGNVIIPDNWIKASEYNINVCMTSWKGRINNLMPTINSLLNQSLKADKIWLTLAKEELTEGDIPNEVKELDKNGDICIKWVEQDLKTLKKVFPVLPELNDDDIIINADDDIVFDKDFIKNRINDYERHKNPISSENRYYYKGMYLLSGPGSLFTKKMLKGYNLFCNDKVISTYEDDWIYSFLILLNSYRFEKASKYYVKDYELINQETSSKELYNTAKTRIVLEDRVNEFIGMNFDEFLENKYKARWE